MTDDEANPPSPLVRSHSRERHGSSCPSVAKENNGAGAWNACGGGEVTGAVAWSVMEGSVIEGEEIRNLGAPKRHTCVAIGVPCRHAARGLRLRLRLRLRLGLGLGLR